MIPDTDAADTVRDELLRPVARVRDVSLHDLIALLARFGLRLQVVAADAAIPGSYWGQPEAGLIGDTLYCHDDTPLQSALHEACHYICMSAARRAALNEDAGGDFDEENAVCYLQILLAEHIAGFGAERMLIDMDAWGYTFRLGGARAWFEQDAEDARQWLLREQLITAASLPTGQLRR